MYQTLTLGNGCVHPGVPVKRTRQPAGGPACLFVRMRTDQLRLSVAIFVSSDDEMAAVNTIQYHFVSWTEIQYF